MRTTQALVAIWLNVAPQNHEEFRRWHNCEHSTDRMDGPGFRVSYRYNAMAQDAHHDFLCVFEGDDLAAFESAYYLESRNNPSPWTRKCMAFIRDAERAVLSLQESVGEPHRYDAPYVYAVSVNPAGGEDVKREILDWYREEHLPRLCALKGVTRGRVFQHEAAATGGETAEARIQDTKRSGRTLLAMYDLEDPHIPVSQDWADAAYGTPRSAAMKIRLKEIIRESWWLDFAKWKRE